jgi:hypothetical protein
MEIAAVIPTLPRRNYHEHEYSHNPSNQNGEMIRDITPKWAKSNGQSGPRRISEINISSATFFRYA